MELFWLMWFLDLFFGLMIYTDHNKIKILEYVVGTELY